MVRQGKTEKKQRSKQISKGKRSKPLRKRQEIKREQIRKKLLIRKIKYITTLVVLVIIVAIVVIFYPSPSHEDNINNDNTPNGINGDNIGIEEGQTAPNFELTDTDGNKINLKELRGSIVLIDFMAIWCGPCETEIGHLKDVQLNYSSHGVKIVSIDVDNSESSAQLKGFKQNHSCDWLFAAGGGGVAETYGVKSIPTIYIIDKQGIITYKNVGLTDYTKLSFELDKLVG